MDTRSTTQPCQVHVSHQPRSHINEHHHIWPLGHAGPDVGANRITVCASGHNSIHALLDKWLAADGDPGWDVRRHYTRGERTVARLGYQRIKRGSL
jgi:hypothetical protein